ncbi:MAG: hypothetical protein ACKOWG_07015 [Planctomycetia bacterium]
MATIPQIRERLLEGFSDKQADLLAHVVIEAHDDLVNRADFHALTGVVKEMADAQKDLAEAQKRTEIRIEELADAQKRTEVRIEELADAQKRTEVRVEELADAQKRTEVRVEELTDAQKRTEVRIEELTDAQKRTEVRVGKLASAQEGLAEAQARTENSVDQLARAQRAMLIRLDKVDGRSLEIDVARRLPAIVGVAFRRCRVIELSELVESIEDRISEAERRDLLQTDVVAKAKRDSQELHLIVEVSCTADSDDVARALRRAAVLSKAGLPAVGIVACEAIADKTLASAMQEGVRVIVEGKFMPEAA